MRKRIYIGVYAQGKGREPGGGGASEGLNWGGCGGVCLFFRGIEIGWWKVVRVEKKSNLRTLMALSEPSTETRPLVVSEEKRDRTGRGWGGDTLERPP